MRTTSNWENDSKKCNTESLIIVCQHAKGSKLYRTCQITRTQHSSVSILKDHNDDTSENTFKVWSIKDVNPHETKMSNFTLPKINEGVICLVMHKQGLEGQLFWTDHIDLGRPFRRNYNPFKIFSTHKNYLTDEYRGSKPQLHLTALRNSFLTNNKFVISFLL